MHPKTGSLSFFTQIGSQRVPGHPEAKSDQILIRNGLLEAILEASRPASKPASQAQPLGRVFSTKRTRGQDHAPYDKSVEFFRPDWSPKDPRTSGGQRLVEKTRLNERSPIEKTRCKKTAYSATVEYYAFSPRKNSSLNGHM